MATSFLLFTSAFWAEPLDLRTFIIAPKQVSEPSSRSQVHPDHNNSLPQTTQPVDRPPQHAQIKHAAVDQEAHDWEVRGDKAAAMYIALEGKASEVLQSQEETTQFGVELQEGFKQANTAWTNALKTAVTGQYKTALQTKLKSSSGGGFTCEFKHNDDNPFCYSNGSEYDVLNNEDGIPITFTHISRKP